MRLINLTPHPISLANAAGEITKTIPTSGTIARVSTETITTGRSIAGCPIVKNTQGQVTNLPEAKGGTVYIVSLFVLSALSDRNDVVAPDTGATCVRGDQGRITAVRQFLTA